MDYPKRCPNRLMFNGETKECDWEDKVDCKGREKFIGSFGFTLLFAAVDKTSIGEKNDHFKRKNESQVKNAFKLHKNNYQNNTRGKS
jgi:hypothetical protein